MVTMLASNETKDTKDPTEDPSSSHSPTALHVAHDLGSARKIELLHRLFPEPILEFLAFGRVPKQRESGNVSTPTPSTKVSGGFPWIARTA